MRRIFVVAAIYTVSAAPRQEYNSTTTSSVDLQGQSPKVIAVLYRYIIK